MLVKGPLCASFDCFSLPQPWWWPFGIAADDAPAIDDLFKQKCQGSRCSFGYPACPALEDQQKLLPLLEASRICVMLSEEFQLVPEQSTSAVICHHPSAKYFNVSVTNPHLSPRGACACTRRVASA